jgi:chromosome segregation ATPase
MFIDYKIKKYNFKIINAIKKNDINKIPEYLHHISFYLKENLNNNNFIGGKPPKTSDKNTDLDSVKISSELDKSLAKLKSLKEHLIHDISEKKKSDEERNTSNIKKIEQTKNNELCKTKEEYTKQINRNNLAIDELKKDNQSKLSKISDLEKKLVLLETSNSSENEKIIAEIQENKLTIQQNKLIIEQNKSTIEQLETKNIDLNEELALVYEKLDRTQESRQSNYTAGLNAIKKFRILTQELSTFPGMEKSNLLDIFGFSNEKQLEEDWGLKGNASNFILGKTTDVPVLPVINA